MQNMPFWVWNARSTWASEVVVALHHCQISIKFDNDEVPQLHRWPTWTENSKAKIVALSQ